DCPGCRSSDVAPRWGHRGPGAAEALENRDKGRSARTTHRRPDGAVSETSEQALDRRVDDPDHDRGRVFAGPRLAAEDQPRSDASTLIRVGHEQHSAARESIVRTYVRREVEGLVHG